MSEFKVQFITAEETMDLRMRVLRPFHPREKCEYAEDQLPSTFHLGVVHEGRVVSNGTFMQQAHPSFENARLAYRLRGMATDPAMQGRGLGRMIIQAAESELQKRKCDFLWFNARTGAEKFYSKLGYTAVEQVFEIEGVGPHKVMYKHL